MNTKRLTSIIEAYHVIVEFLKQLVELDSVTAGSGAAVSVHVQEYWSTSVSQQRYVTLFALADTLVQQRLW